LTRIAPAATTSTAVRRRVDVNDGRLVIRTTIVETPSVAAPGSEVVVSAPVAPVAPVVAPAAIEPRHRWLAPRQGKRPART
jgi:hypothetical protein